MMASRRDNGITFSKEQEPQFEALRRAVQLALSTGPHFTSRPPQFEHFSLDSTVGIHLLLPPSHTMRSAFVRPGRLHGHRIGKFHAGASRGGDSGLLNQGASCSFCPEMGRMRTVRYYDTSLTDATSETGWEAEIPVTTVSINSDLLEARSPGYSSRVIRSRNLAVY